MMVRNVLSALLLSLFLTFITAVIYIFYPLVIILYSNREGNGIGAGSLSFLLILEPLLFMFIFAVLQRRSKKNKFPV